MDESQPLAIVGAGGTGGHMFPAAAFAEALKARGWRIGLISDARGLRFADTFPADWTEAVNAASPNLRRPWTLPRTAWRLAGGIHQAQGLMRRTAPQLVAGFGGYPAFPVLAAARRGRIPILIHEQNAVLGRVNRRFAAHADAVASGFPRLDRRPRGIVHVPLGNPVRQAVADCRDAPYPGLDGTLNILVTGGSQGAQMFGTRIPPALTAHVPAPLRHRLKVVQQVREAQVEEVRGLYAAAGIEAEIAPFFSDMARRLSDAHLVIARAGAGTVSELACVGRPAILIPLAIAMDDHQTANAAALVDVSAADLLTEGELTPKRLGALVTARLSHPDELRQRAQRAHLVGTVTAARDLADLAEKVSGRSAAPA